jgi:hypothetical protein
MRRVIMLGLTATAGLAGFAGAESMIRPGLWKTTSIVTAVDMPGAPPQVAAMMKGKPTTVSHCVTPEEVAKDPRALMQTDKSCKVQQFSMAGGRMSATMVCQQRGASMTVRSAGTYTPTSYTATASMVMTGGGGMKMTTNVSSKLIGACK